MQGCKDMYAALPDRVACSTCCGVKVAFNSGRLKSGSPRPITVALSETGQPHPSCERKGLLPCPPTQNKTLNPLTMVREYILDLTLQFV
jgi:hypothetical protein